MTFSDSNFSPSRAHKRRVFDLVPDPIRALFAEKSDGDSSDDSGKEDGSKPTGGNGQDKKPGGPEGQPQPGSGRSMFGFVLLILLGVMLITLFSQVGQGQQVDWQTFKAHYENGEIDGMPILTNSGITARLLQQGVDEKVKTIRVPINAADNEVVSGELFALTNGAYTSKPESPMMQLLIVFAPFLLLILLVWFLISRSLRGAGGGGGGMLGNFGKSRHKTMAKEMTGVTFADVAGIEEAEEEVSEIIEFLRNPKRFARIGGRIPRGVLLIGQPGCGKTLLAKAIAGEADVPFFSISGSDFVEMFVGVGASRVRDLFKQAKEASPCIIFLDEIDAVGRRRGGGFSQGGHDEREQTLNAILVEMDGFNSGDGVIVVAATNRADVLDPALTRPGRFDRQITVSLPDVNGRLQILKVHAKKVKLGPDVNLERVARGTPMFSGADLAAIINEAAIGATLQNKEFIEHEDIEEARDKVKFGRAKKSRAREEDENKLVAFHEAGHAVLQALLKDSDPLHKVTIIPRGESGGATFSLPEKDRMGYGLKWLLATMRVLCGGRIAEQKAMQDVSSGASQDIAQITQLARLMVLDWGMSEKLGFIKYTGEDSQQVFTADRDYSDDTAKIIDQEVRRIVDESYGDAERLLNENWDRVVDVAEALLKYETLAGDEVHQILRGELLNKPTVADLLKVSAKKDASSPPPATPASDEDPEFPPDGALPSPA